MRMPHPRMLALSPRRRCGPAAAAPTVDGVYHLKGCPLGGLSSERCAEGAPPVSKEGLPCCHVEGVSHAGGLLSGEAEDCACCCVCVEGGRCCHCGKEESSLSRGGCCGRSALAEERTACWGCEGGESSDAEECRAALEEEFEAPPLGCCNSAHDEDSEAGWRSFCSQDCCPDCGNRRPLLSDSAEASGGVGREKRPSLLAASKNLRELQRRAPIDKRTQLEREMRALHRKQQELLERQQRMHEQKLLHATAAAPNANGNAESARRRVAKKPWNSDLQDLSNLRASPTDRLLRHVRSTSPHFAVAASEYRAKLALMQRNLKPFVEDFQRRFGDPRREKFELQQKQSLRVAAARSASMAARHRLSRSPRRMRPPPATEDEFLKGASEEAFFASHRSGSSSFGGGRRLESPRSARSARAVRASLSHGHSERAPARGGCERRRGSGGCRRRVSPSPSPRRRKERLPPRSGVRRSSASRRRRGSCCSCSCCHQACSSDFSESGSSDSESSFRDRNLTSGDSARSDCSDCSRRGRSRRRQRSRRRKSDRAGSSCRRRRHECHRCKGESASLREVLPNGLAGAATANSFFSLPSDGVPFAAALRANFSAAPKTGCASLSSSVAAASASGLAIPSLPSQPLLGQTGGLNVEQEMQLLEEIQRQLQMLEPFSSEAGGGGEHPPHHHHPHHQQHQQQQHQQQRAAAERRLNESLLVVPSPEPPPLRAQPPPRVLLTVEASRGGGNSLGSGEDEGRSREAVLLQKGEKGASEKAALQQEPPAEKTPGSKEDCDDDVAPGGGTDLASRLQRQLAQLKEQEELLLKQEKALREELNRKRAAAAQKRRPPPRKEEVSATPSSLLRRQPWKTAPS